MAQLHPLTKSMNGRLPSLGIRPNRPRDTVQTGLWSDGLQHYAATAARLTYVLDQQPRLPCRRMSLSSERASCHRQRHEMQNRSASALSMRLGL